MRARLATVSLKRLSNVADATPAIGEDEGAIEIGRAAGHVAFENVTFSYVAGEPPVLPRDRGEREREEAEREEDGRRAAPRGSDRAASASAAAATA